MAVLCLNFQVMSQSVPIQITGTVLDKLGKPIAGANVGIPLSKAFAATDSYGKFTIRADQSTGELMVSSIGYKTTKIAYGPKPNLQIILEESTGSLDEVVVIAYGKTTRRLNTGSVGQVSAAEIALQPVSNPLSALQGRVAGLSITQNSGINGAGVKVQIRGQASLMQGSDPLFIIDGVPFASGNSSINSVTNATGTAGISPFSTVNPADIESVEVLKDADATSIYGSRGANGVILITTKKGVSGKTRFSLNGYSGFSQVTRTMDMLNTQDYLMMRKEAFKNDGAAMTNANAPDLLLWDQNRYTDFKKLLVGGTAKTNDWQASVSGGNENTRFLFSSGYHGETSVFPGEQRDDKISGRLSLNHRSKDERFTLDLSTSYSYNKNKMSAGDLTGFINMPPHMSLYKPGGTLNWEDSGVFFDGALTNPLAATNKRYTGKFNNANTSLNLSYMILLGLKAKINMGYNSVNGEDQALNPSTSINPNSGNLPYANFGRSALNSWIVEPQAEFNKTVGRGKINILLGGTLQNISSNSLNIIAQNYRNDMLLSSIAAAGNVITRNSDFAYRYSALYGRIGYNLKDRYLVNLTGRRDGSSRFGPGKQFAAFGAIGVAWIFSSESFIASTLPWLSFGKLRGSYGSSGNDQIGNYRFLDTWTSTNQPYQGGAGLQPSSLYNADLSWEISRKAELAIELGVLDNRFLLTTAYFRNRSSNQLINYKLPSQTGFSSILRNFGALIQNSGLELGLESKFITTRDFSWSSVINFSLPQNKLVKFPGLETSSYATVYFLGKSLSTQKTLEYLGVDPATGIYTFRDVNGDGQYDSKDRTQLINTLPKFYGGLQNSFTYKGLKLDVFLEFKKQLGYNYLYTQSVYIPGYYYLNQPKIVLQRWQSPGDITNIQRFAATGDSPAFLPAGDYLADSDAIFSDASFIRVKNISLAYTFSGSWIKKMKLEKLGLYLHAQNLFTITGYEGADPESQNLFILPPLKTITMGIQITL